MNTEKKIDKIGGWLWIPAIGLLFTPVIFVNDSILPLFRNYFPMRVVVDYVILIADLILLAFIGLLMWFFFKRKVHTQALFILLILFMVLMWFIIDGVHESQNDPPFIAMIFYCLVLVPLFVLSKRSQQTFIVELSENVKVEKIIIRSAGFFRNFYNFFKKIRYFIFLVMLLYLVIGVILNCALRSLRIDGDILHTFDYL